MNDSYLLALVILLLCYLKFLVYLIFCDNILVVDLVTLVVDMFVDVVAALVATGLAGVIVMIDTSVAVVPSSISPPISVTGGTLESLGLPQISLSLPLDISALYKSDIMVTAGNTNPGGNRKPDNTLKGIRNPIPQDPDNPLKRIQDLVQNGTRSQWPRGLTIPT